MPNPRHHAGIGRLVALATLVVVVTTSCGGAATPPPASPVAASPSGPAAASTSPSAGPIASLDPETSALADRLRAPSYTADTTAATVEVLARSGIATFESPASPGPRRAVDGTRSPLRMLDFQTHALAVGAWAGSGLTGAELDGLLPVTSEDGSLPPISAVLAGYVAAGESRGAEVSRALLAGENLREPGSVQFPALVLVLFASDIATDGGRAGSSVLTPLANSAPGVDAPHALLAAATLCSDAASFIDGTIRDLFAALKVATPANAVGKLVANIWNWIVDQGERFVRTLIRTVTDAVLGTIRTIAGAIAAVAEQVASFLPYAVKVRTLQSNAQGASENATFFLLPTTQLGGQFGATVTAGDLPDWPDLLKDCATTAQIALPSFRSANLPVIWGPIRGAASQYLGVTLADQTTDNQGQARWTFITVLDPGPPDGEQVNVVDQMPVVVHRPEIAAARASLTSALLGPVPEVLRGFVGRLFAPFVDALQGRLNGLLDARGLGHATVVYHAGVRASAVATATPSSSPTPTASSRRPLPNACTLLTAADVAGVVGQPVEATNDAGGIVTDPTMQSVCNYAVNNGASSGIVLTLTQPASLDAILRARKTTPIAGLADRAFTWDIGAQRSAGAQAGDLVLQVVLSTKFYAGAAATRLLTIAVSHL